MGKIGINILSRKRSDFRILIHYKMIEELFNEDISDVIRYNRAYVFLTNLMDCKKRQTRVRKLQFRIVMTLEAIRYKKAKALQHLLDKSLDRKCMELQT